MVRTPLENRVGQRVGKLVVRSIGKGRQHGKRNVVVECDCGSVKEISSTNLFSPTNPRPKSCGCIKQVRGRTHHNYSGGEHVSASFVSRIRSNARLRSVPFRLTVTDLERIWNKQRGKCALTGLSLTLPMCAADWVDHAHTASVDRIDSSKGYTPSNVQWVHKTVNMMKRQLSVSEFVTFCRLVANQHPTAASS